jgi:lipoprotein-anchoring transpeptidase ErfK/SrfK
MSRDKKITRREFLRLSTLAFGGLALSRREGFQQNLEKWLPLFQEEIPEFPEDKWLGRICVGEPGAHFDIKSEPDWNAPTVDSAWRDDVFEWKREVISKQFDINLINQRWVETPEGYIYAEYVQKTRHEPQEILTELPEQPTGERGMWVEITTPLTGLDLTTSQENYQYWIRETIKPRIYYSQVFWAFDIRHNPETGKPQYRLKQLHGAWPDTYWVDADVCRMITPEEIAPIHPEAEDKHIIVDLAYQTLSCYEGDQEVYFTKVTTGGYNWQEEKWRTPVGTHTIWRKLVSTHMSAGPAVGNYDVPGIAWTTLFDNNGAAIHSTYWHNYFGKPMSHGCVNTRPEDAKWVFRWTEPAVPYNPGLVEIQGMHLSTSVEVIAP